jgi:hypothetical protein
MRALPLKNLLTNNISLKIISIILGYSFWHIASYNTLIQKTFTVPLSFITNNDNCTINAPEEITVTLHAKRHDFALLDSTSLAAHVPISTLQPGKHALKIDKQHLFLPHNVSLVHYTPSNLSVTITTE